MELTTASMMDVLAPKRLIREVRKQLKLNDIASTEKVENFEKTRLQLIESVVPVSAANRSKVVKDVEWWFKTELPNMKDPKDILGAAHLRLEAGRDFCAMLPPFRAQQSHLAELSKAQPGRVYTVSNKTFILIKPGEKAVFDGLKLTFAEQEPLAWSAPKPAAPPSCLVMEL